MKYTYYEKIESNDHYVFAEEICEIYSDILPEHVTPHMIHKIIRTHVANNNIPFRTFYHMTGKGLKRVYPLDVVFDALTDYISNYNHNLKEAKRNE